MFNLNESKASYLLNKHDQRFKILEGASGKPLSWDRKLAIAQVIENAQGILNEATNSVNIGQYQRHAVNILTTAVPSLIAFDIMSVQPMEKRVGMINYIKYNYSNDKGQTKAGTPFASSLNMGKVDYNYTSDLVSGEEIVASSQAANQYSDIALKWYPVKMSTLHIYTEDGTLNAVADASGKITGTGIDASGTNQVHPSGALSFKTQGVSASKPILVSYRFDNESVSGSTSSNFANVPEVELEIASVPVEAKARTLKTNFSMVASYELQKDYGKDADKMMATQAAHLLSEEIDNELTIHMLEKANAGAHITWSRTLTPGISQRDHYDSFLIKLTEGSNIIFNATRKVKANFIVCGLGVSNVVENIKGFQHSGQTSMTGSHFLGTLPNGMKVYVNPYYEVNSFVLGYKGDNIMDAGMFYCPYMPIMPSDLIMDANLRGQQAWATMYGLKMVNDKMYLKGHITD